jgi:hypothetical protein
MGVRRLVPACHKPGWGYAGLIVTLRRHEGAIGVQSCRRRGGELMSEIYRFAISDHEANEDQAEQCLNIRRPLTSDQMAHRALVEYPELKILPEGLLPRTSLSHRYNYAVHG